jgi:hypothetical protein
VRRQELVPRTICNEPIVFWRKEDSTPAEKKRGHLMPSALR